MPSKHAVVEEDAPDLIVQQVDNGRKEPEEAVGRVLKGPQDVPSGPCLRSACREVVERARNLGSSNGLRMLSRQGRKAVWEIFRSQRWGAMAAPRNGLLTSARRRTARRCEVHVCQARMLYDLVEEILGGIRRGIDRGPAAHDAVLVLGPVGSDGLETHPGPRARPSSRTTPSTPQARSAWRPASRRGRPR